jgi:hypothetical protein
MPNLRLSLEMPSDRGDTGLSIANLNSELLISQALSGSVI